MNTNLEQTRDELAEATPDKLRRAKAAAEDWAARGADRVRDLRDGVLDRADRAGSRTVDYVKDEPVKSLLMAAALGAAIALLARALSRGRQ